MTDLNQTIMQKASGESRLNPDEQRLYLGTFRERIVSCIKLENCGNPLLLKKIPQIFDQLTAQYHPLSLKISGLLDSTTTMTLLAVAEASGIRATVVTEENTPSIYGLILHTDKAINLEVIDAEVQFKALLAVTSQQAPEKQVKKSFLEKFFGK